MKTKSNIKNWSKKLLWIVPLIFLGIFACREELASETFEISELSVKTSEINQSFVGLEEPTMKLLLNGTFGSFWLGIFPHYGVIDKRFLEIQETLRRVSFFVGDFGGFFLVLLCFLSRLDIKSLTQIR